MSGRSEVNQLPRIVFVGKEAMTPEHSTGALIAQHFSNYPKSKMLDISWRSSGSHFLLPHRHIGSESLGKIFWKSAARTRINDCLSGDGISRSSSLIYKSRVFDPININWKEFCGAPDLIYSTCSSAEDFSFLHHVYRNLPKKIPIIQHFIDVNFNHYNYMLELYYDLLPAMAAIWTDTLQTLYAVNHFSPTKAEWVQTLHRPLPEIYKTKHRKFSKSFKSVLGSFSPSISGAVALQHLWSTCNERLSGLSPARAARPGRGLGHLYQQIRSADMGVLPLTGYNPALDHAYQYSLPTSLGDFCVNGLPIAVISGRGTAVRKIVEENELGIVIDPSDPKLAARGLSHFIFDQQWRSECGRKARYFAEKELNISFYQKELHERVLNISKRRFPRPGENKKFLGLAFHG